MVTCFLESQASLGLVSQWFLLPQGLAVPGATGRKELQAQRQKGSAPRGFQIERLFKYLPNNSPCALEQAAGGALAESREVQAFDRNVEMWLFYQLRLLRLHN